MYLGSLNLLSITTTVHERPAYIGATGLSMILPPPLLQFRRYANTSFV